MFKPAKKNSFKAKEKVDFKLEFHATRVPQRGWDKLLVSLIYLETNKVVAKTGKVPVKNGACQWSEPVYESPLIYQEANGKDAAKALYKLVVSMGLSRFGVLGEVAINLADYMQAIVPISLPLQLQNCNAGSILHVKMQRIISKSGNRESEDQKAPFLEEACHVAMLDSSPQDKPESYEQKSDISDKNVSATPRLSLDSIDAPSTPEVSESRIRRRDALAEELVSPSSSIGSNSGRTDTGNSFHDYAGFSQTEFTDQHYVNECNSPRESIIDLTFSPYHSTRSHDGTEIKSAESPANGKSKELEVAKATINELTLEIATSERRVKQMEMEIEALKKQLARETTRNEELQRALPRSEEECDSVKLDLHNLCFVGKARENLAEGFNLRELQDELEYEKSVNSNLSLQLRKTQESNSELLLEIRDLGKLLHEKDEGEKQANRGTESRDAEGESTNQDLKEMVGSLKKELEELERDSQELTEENMDLISQLKQANDKLKVSEITNGQLELKINSELCIHEAFETEKLRSMVEKMRETLRDCEESYESKLATSRTLIDDLNSSVMMVRSKNTRLERELQSSGERISELVKEIESLKMENDEQQREIALFASQKGQLKSLREKASKAEQEYRNALKRVEEVEGLNRELKAEKSRDLSAIKKQLEEFQEHALSTDRKYKETAQVMVRMREEKLGLEKDISILLERKEAIEATVAHLQSFNVVMQEKLHAEEQKVLELVEQCKEKEAKLSESLEDLKGSESRIKLLEQTETDLEILQKEMEGKVCGLQEENMVCRSQIKDLELNIVVKEEEILSLQTLSSTSYSKLQNLQAENGDLSEKLKNAQEDIDWARENTNTLVNEIRELEGEIESDMVVQKRLEQSVSELEAHKGGLKTQIEQLSNKNVQLERKVVDLEGQYKDVMNEKDAFLVSMEEQKSAYKDLKASLEAIIKEQQDKIQQLLAFDVENRVQEALQDALVLRDEKHELEEKLKQVQEMMQQAKKNALDGESKEKQALLEASMLRDEKINLEENVQKLEEMLKQAKKEALTLKQNLDFQFEEAAAKELGRIKKLDEMMVEAQHLREEKLNYSQRVMALEAQCAVAEIEKKKMFTRLGKREGDFEVLQREKEEGDRALSSLKEGNNKLRARLEKTEQEMATLKEQIKSYDGAAGLWNQSKASMEILRKEKEERERAFSSLKEEKENLKEYLENTEQEMAILKAKIVFYEEEASLWKQSKESMEETIFHLQDVTAKEKEDELSKMKKQTDELRCKLSKQDVETKKLKQKVVSLQEELHCKATALSSCEKNLKSSPSNVDSLAGSFSRTISGVGPLSAIPSTQEAKECSDLREKVNLLGELKMKVTELELSKQQLKEQHVQLTLKNEHLQSVNEQLLKEHSNNSMDQILKELNSLQSQNAALCQQEVELLSKQEALQSELENVKEEKQVLELALSSFNTAANSERFSKRIATLEIELAEVLEANHMYKKQLQSAFAKQHNVHVAALENLGSVDEVIRDLADLKRRNKMLEDELKDMHERYFNMSLQFAELESEREELVMTVRTLRGVKKLTPYKSANF